MTTTTTRVPLRTSPPTAVIKRKRRGSITLTVLTSLMGIYALIPLAWLVINATKTQDGLFTSFGLWFDDGHFALWDNLRDTFTYDHGIYLRWLGNTLLYVVVGAGGATFLAVLAGYGLAKFDFPGKRGVFGTVIGAVAVPPSALAVPTFLMFSKLGLTNTPLAVLIPSLIVPFGLYLMWTFATEAIPAEMLEAARVDGASEMRTFFRISVPLLAPGIVTVLLFSMVATMNNYLLPLIMLKNPDWYPLTVGLNSWNAQATTAGGQAVFNLVIAGSLIMIVLLLAAFLTLQRYWQSGLAAGSVKE
jgi:multiple sugar transport system permease protein